MSLLRPRFPFCRQETVRNPFRGCPVTSIEEEPPRERLCRAEDERKQRARCEKERKRGMRRGARAVNGAEGNGGWRSQFSNGPGESGGYTFTDLHYPRFAPSSGDATPTRAYRQRTNCPVTHGGRVLHVIAVTHKIAPAPGPAAPPPSTVF